MNSWKASKNVPTGTQVEASVDIVVENLGRVNYGKPHDFNQKKGLWEGPVSIDGDILSNWTIMLLQFQETGLEICKVFYMVKRSGFPNLCQPLVFMLRSVLADGIFDFGR